MLDFLSSNKVKAEQGKRAALRPLKLAAISNPIPTLNGADTSRVQLESLAEARSRFVGKAQSSGESVVPLRSPATPRSPLSNLGAERSFSGPIPRPQRTDSTPSRAAWRNATVGDLDIKGTSLLTPSSGSNSPLTLSPSPTFVNSPFSSSSTLALPTEGITPAKSPSKFAMASKFIGAAMSVLNRRDNKRGPIDKAQIRVVPPQEEQRRGSEEITRAILNNHNIQQPPEGSSFGQIEFLTNNNAYIRPVVPAILPDSPGKHPLIEVGIDKFGGKTPVLGDSARITMIPSVVKGKANDIFAVTGIELPQVITPSNSQSSQNGVPSRDSIMSLDEELATVQIMEVARPVKIVASNSAPEEKIIVRNALPITIEGRGEAESYLAGMDSGDRAILFGTARSEKPDTTGIFLYELTRENLDANLERFEFQFSTKKDNTGLPLENKNTGEVLALAKGTLGGDSKLITKLYRMSPEVKQAAITRQNAQAAKKSQGIATGKAMGSDEASVPQRRSSSR